MRNVVTIGAERARLWAKAVARYPFLVEHQAKTTRQIPVVALERPEGGTTRAKRRGTKPRGQSSGQSSST